MELDILFEVTVAKPWEGSQREAERRKFESVIEQAKLADKLGFRTAWCVEHHFREGRSHSSAPEVLIGALSQVTRNIRLGFGVALMPHGFGSPVRVAGRLRSSARRLEQAAVGRRRQVGRRHVARRPIHLG
jgi:alkanesulfonate monooxygenase SsuD/methylene tetrahydromethanopterin reductase-like flavin-dependent oxidoreductase (luciferase family)